MNTKKLKAVTFSYDDGVTQDVRLIEMFKRYGLKATFNLNSELLGNERELVRNDVTVNHSKVKPENVSEVYSGHEIAVHTLTHPNLTEISTDEVIRQVEQDRLNLEMLVDYSIVGMAYPCGGENNNDEVAKIIANNTKIQYARTITSSYSFEPQKNLLRYNPTVYHLEIDKMFELGEKFIKLKPETPQVFYIWGHSYEFDAWDFWDRMEEFCRMISGHDDIFYGTNKEVLL